MSAARKTKHQAPEASLRERAEATRSAAGARIRGSDPVGQSEHCQASVIADRLAALAVEWAEADEREVLSGVRASAIAERIQTLVEALSYSRAASSAGMLGQIAVAFDAVGTVLEGRDDLRKPAADRAKRCLYSVASALSAQSGIDRDCCGASYLMPVEHDWLACLAPEIAR